MKYFWDVICAMISQFEGEVPVIKKMRFMFVVMLFLSLGVGIVEAQAQDNETCPTNILLAFSRALTACASTRADEACYGAGSITIEGRRGAPVFSQPGDQIALNDVAVIRTISDAATWSAAQMNMHSSFDRTRGRIISVWLFGNTLYANNSPDMPELSVFTVGLANLRAEPADSAPLIAQVDINTRLTANGRTTDGTWIRVFVPGMDAMGWVSTLSIGSTGFSALEPVTNPLGGYARPFQFGFFTSGVADAPCEGAPNSGMLIQSPSAREQPSFLINNAIISVAGTVFIQSQPGGEMLINALDGFAEVTTDLTNRNDPSVFTVIPAGSRVRVQLDEVGLASMQPLAAEPYLLTSLQGLPVNNVPVRVQTIPPPLPTELIATQVEIRQTTRIPATPLPPTPDTTCRREMRFDDDLYAGPGTFYEVSGRLVDAALVIPVLETTDPDGIVWWQLISGAWVKKDSVRQTGICTALPLVDAAPPPATNTLIMETCEADNGPIRAGQVVTIRFTPPSFLSMNEAIAAPGIDPGEILIDGTSIPIQVTEPLRLTPTAVARTWFGQWTATRGTHRIIGDRGAYSVICDLTVPS